MRELSDSEREAVCIGYECDALPLFKHSNRCDGIANEVERILEQRRGDALALASGVELAVQRVRRALLLEDLREALEGDA